MGFFFFSPGSPKVLGVLRGPNRFIPKSVLFLAAKDSSLSHVPHLLGMLGALKQSIVVGVGGVGGDAW